MRVSGLSDEFHYDSNEGDGSDAWEECAEHYQKRQETHKLELKGEPVLKWLVGGWATSQQ